MTSPSTAASSHRVLIVLDASTESLDALRTAAAVAARRKADLVALYVEDVNLIHLAGLPFAREVDRASALERQLDEFQMMRALRARAARVRQALARATEKLDVHCSVQIVRGKFVSEALSAAAAMDVLFISKAAHGASSALGSLSQALQGKRRSAQIEARDRARGLRPIWVLFDGSSAAHRALTMASDLTLAEKRELVVALQTPDTDETERLRRDVADTLGERHPSIKYVTISAIDVSSLLQAIRGEGCSLLVLNRDNAQWGERRADALVEALDCPVVVVP